MKRILVVLSLLVFVGVYAVPALTMPKDAAAKIVAVDKDKKVKGSKATDKKSCGDNCKGTCGKDCKATCDKGTKAGCCEASSTGCKGTGECTGACKTACKEKCKTSEKGACKEACGSKCDGAKCGGKK